MIGEISTELAKLKNKAETARIVRKVTLRELERLENDYEQQKKDLDNYQKARVVIQQVAEDTQKHLEYHISNIVTMALKAIFPNPYEFRIKFVQRRNKTECDLLFVKDGKELDPCATSGGGALDAASFSLRVAIWSLRKTRRVLILDEPFKFLSVDLQDKCSEMLKQVSEKLGIQIIMVSHLPNIISAADKIIRVVNENGVACVEE